MDTGDDNADPSQIKVPFTATPPVSRVEPKRGQTVKVMYTGATALPKDRESVYWFNVLEVPPKPKDAEADKNLLQLAFRTRIKLFYRPSGLQGEPAEAPAKITRKLNNAQLQANNPTPYYVSFNEVKLESGGKTYNVNSSMVTPFSRASFGVTSLPEACHPEKWSLKRSTTLAATLMVPQHSKNKRILFNIAECNLVPVYSSKSRIPKKRYLRPVVPCFIAATVLRRTPWNMTVPF